MTDRPPVVRAVADLRAAVARFRADAHSTALVPTMGALHEGHLKLIELAKTRAAKCVVSIFVNPAQFGEGGDFAAYPRDEARDIEAAAAAADLVFAPGASEMYPPGYAAQVTVPGLSDDLEGAFRPGFFTGVATVVTKLLLQAQPDIAVFGEKDYQQLLVIRRLAADLDMPVQIIGAPTVREADGLALSSRNAYLTPDERRRAPALHRALLDTAEGVLRGEDAALLTAAAETTLLDAGFEAPDYITVRRADTLAPAAGLKDLEGRPGRVLGAAQLGRARLIDNVPIDL